jgi:hypothetical protein
MKENVEIDKTPVIPVTGGIRRKEDARAATRVRAIMNANPVSFEILTTN